MKCTGQLKLTAIRIPSTHQIEMKLLTVEKHRETTNRKKGTQMVDNKLAVEEAERSANYEAIKSGVKSQVGGEIRAEAVQPSVGQAEKVEATADRMRRRAVDEVVETEREVDRARGAARF